jgi:hypothetical protein
MKYYKEQLNQLVDDHPYFKSIQVRDTVGNSTHCLALNIESIPIFIAFLKKEQKRLKNLEQTAEKSNGGNENENQDHT